jgi:uncharacterized protein YneF (UPF0154 family)
MSEHTNIPHPDDYHLVRSFLEDNPDIVEFGVKLLMQMAGSTCPVSTRQAVADHMSMEAGQIMKKQDVSVSLSESHLRKVIRRIIRASL